MKPVIKFALGSILVGGAVLTLKFLAARISGSAALFSDALESLVNVAASSLALYALIGAAKPADRQHPYGHAKVELLSAVATGALILIAAVLIFEQALHVLLHPVPLAPLRGALGQGMALNGAAGLLLGVWAVLLRQTGKRHRSPALAADAQHLVSDVLTTIGIILGLVAAASWGLPVLDPVLAVLIAGQIAFAGGRTVLRSLSGLLDEAPPPAITARINELVRMHGTGAIEAHDFRTRQAGPASFLEFHLVVPGAMSVDEAHDICDRIEAALKHEMPGAVITIHVEPEEKAKHEGVLIED
ncbi:MAG: cation-efflux pump [Acidocella sp. 20-57-95]|nr:MAG: cation-efflux pump [Acidocella sp. 20-57-95]OYV59273.1 MAG: cation-efflux pump [Acidocella sp. 21-58-7]HQT63936.1 cation diffusion facilitator family transporter [Acidocella sp.]HQU03643.1 cation diffusion facilitator family transporter [Acidocella sp.]